jgi:predicted deacetylase
MTSQSMPNYLAVVTLHDAAPCFSKRIFEFTDALEDLEINFNISLIPFYHHKEDLPRFPEFVNKLKSLDNAEIALHGLYHEDKNGVFDDFSHKTKAAAEEEIRAALEINQEVGIKSNVFVPPQWKLSRGCIEWFPYYSYAFPNIAMNIMVYYRLEYCACSFEYAGKLSPTGAPNILDIIRA